MRSDGMRMVLTMIVTAALVWAAGLGVLYLTQRSFLYFPTDMDGTPAEMGVPEMREVVIATPDGGQTLAWYAPPEQSGGPVIYWMHGNGRNVAARAPRFRMLLDAGLGVMAIEYRGYGGVPGRTSEQTIYNDARGGLNWLMEQGASPGRLVLHGESLGTAVATKMATEYAHAGLILEAPFTAAADIAAWRFPIYPVRMLMHDRFDSMARISKITTPKLWLHGTDDGIVPFRFGQRLYEAMPEPREKFIIEDAGHLDLWQNGVSKPVIAFARHVTGRPPD